MSDSNLQDPIELFATWYTEAREHPEVRYVGAACLSTVDQEGRADARMVIVREVDENGYLFATDARSVKVRQFTCNPDAALTFYWGPIDRSVRIRGRVEEASQADADRCFHDRPRRSKLTVWASHQSRPLDSRDGLVERYDAVVERFDGKDDIPRPESWRAYRLVIHEIEFWQAASARLHDRQLFRRDAGGEWESGRLEP